MVQVRTALLAAFRFTRELMLWCGTAWRLKKQDEDDKGGWCS